MTDTKLVTLSSYRQTRAISRNDGDRPSPRESLRLMKAFLQIDDAKQRAAIIRLVEATSAQKTG
jgi:hypothetical protein